MSFSIIVYHVGASIIHPLERFDEPWMLSRQSISLKNTIIVKT
jgi:hypothetical protein